MMRINIEETEFDTTIKIIRDKKSKILNLISSNNPQLIIAIILLTATIYASIISIPDYSIILPFFFIGIIAGIILLYESVTNPKNRSFLGDYLIRIDKLQKKITNETGHFINYNQYTYFLKKEGFLWIITPQKGDDDKMTILFWHYYQNHRVDDRFVEGFIDSVMSQIKADHSSS